MMQLPGVILALMAGSAAQLGASAPGLEPERVGRAGSQPVLEDPFAELSPMNDGELLEARGGFMVDNQSVDIAGFLIEFSLAASEFSVNASGADIDFTDLQNGTVPEIQFDPGLSTVVIDNTLDNVRISRETTINVHIPNFNSTLSQAAGVSVFTNIANTSILFSGL